MLMAAASRRRTILPSSVRSFSVRQIVEFHGLTSANFNGELVPMGEPEPTELSRVSRIPRLRTIQKVNDRAIGNRRHVVRFDKMVELGLKRKKLALKADI